MKGCFVLSNDSCVYLSLFTCFGKHTKLVHPLMPCMPAPLQLSHSNYSSWLLGYKISKPACSWKMKLDLETWSASNSIPYRQHDSLDIRFQRRLSLSSPANVDSHIPLTTVLCTAAYSGESLPVGQSAQHSFQVRRMQEPKQTQGHSRRQLWFSCMPQRSKRCFPSNPRRWILAWCWQLPIQDWTVWCKVVSAPTEVYRANQYDSVSCQKCRVCAELHHTSKHLFFSKPSSSQPGPTHEAYETQDQRLIREVRRGAKEGTQLWRNHFHLFCHCHPVELPLQHRRESLDWPGVFVSCIYLVWVKDEEEKTQPAQAEDTHRALSIWHSYKYQKNYSCILKCILQFV